MDRIVKGSASPVYVTLLDLDEAPAEATGDVTYTSKYSDGTNGPSGTATAITPTGTYQAVLTVSTFDKLTVTWSAELEDLGEVEQTTEVQVVGRRMFTLAELRAFDSALSNKSATVLRRARNYVEAVFERETTRSFVPAFNVETFSGFRGGDTLWLAKPELREILAYSVDDVEQTFDPPIYRTDDGFNSVYVPLHDRGTVTVSYVYGWDEPPFDVYNAALKLARDAVLGSNSRFDDRAYIINVPDMGVVNLATPGQRGARTGIPEVDVVLDAYDISTGGIA